MEEEYTEDRQFALDDNEDEAPEDNIAHAMITQ